MQNFHRFCWQQDQALIISLLVRFGRRRTSQALLHLRCPLVQYSRSQTDNPCPWGQGLPGAGGRSPPLSVSIPTCTSVRSRTDKGSTFFSFPPFKRGLWLITSEIPNNPSYICINKVYHMIRTGAGVYIKGRLKVG